MAAVLADKEIENMVLALVISHNESYFGASSNTSTPVQRFIKLCNKNKKLSCVYAKLVSVY
jgi:hypothetical protein